MGAYYPILPLTRSLWDDALDPQRYFESLSSHGRLVCDLWEEARAATEEVELVIGALFAPADVDAAESDRRELFIFALTEDRCIDSATVLPYIGRLAEALRVPMRIARRGEYEALVRWYREQGSDRIPIVSIGTIDGDERFLELARWIERPQAIDERMEEWKCANPDFGRLGSIDRTAEQRAQYRALYARLLDEMVRWYRDEGLWRTIALELAAELAPTQD